MELTITQARQQGVTSHCKGELQEAERIYRAILQTQQAHAGANHNRRIIAVAKGQYETALPFLRAAILARSIRKF